MATATVNGVRTDTAAIGAVHVSAATIPTDKPESDGSLAWNDTTIVVVEIHAGDTIGIGYTYSHAAAATLIRETLAPMLEGENPMDVPRLWARMLGAVRNVGREGIAAMAISAVENALWDLKARLLEVPLVTLLGQVHAGAPVYGSGGFTSYNDLELTEQLHAWAERGLPAVKMKVGRAPDADEHRVAVAREAIGDEVELFVDANGAYTRKQALYFAESFADFGVMWFEEPRPSDDLEGLRLVRDRGPAGMDVTAGEYGFDLFHFKRLLEVGAVDCLQADATRCLGITGFMQAAALCEAHGVDLSAHCAPAQHLAPCCAMRPLRHIEYFHDHVRIESMFFDGLPQLRNGTLHPNLETPGNGLELKRQDFDQHALNC